MMLAMENKNALLDFLTQGIGELGIAVVGDLMLDSS
jgi:hypothetical protein